MQYESLARTAAVAEELMAHLRGSERVFSDGPRSHATYETAFNGIFRIEVDHGPECRVALEHVGGGTSDWLLAEWDRRSPVPHGRWGEPSDPPTADEVPYRSELFDADPDRGRRLLDEVQALDWGEPTPTVAGRDGVVLAGSVTTDLGVRSWVGWSPDPAVEPDKSRFFLGLWRLAADHCPSPLSRELALLERYLTGR